eukprot:scaffold229560_cov15-Tisochrysis_lutea.AAC.2
MSVLAPGIASFFRRGSRAMPKEWIVVCRKVAICCLLRTILTFKGAICWEKMFIARASQL